MPRIKCLIIDDEPHAVALLADYARKSEDLDLLGGYNNPIEAFHFLQKNSVDLLFLDIQMPELTGMQLLKLLPAPVQVIFTTAYSEYAIDSYDLEALDYLLKPISFDRFLQSVEKYKKRLKLEKEISPRLSNAPEYIFVKSGHRTLKVALASILYLEALSDYVAIHTLEKKILTLENLRDFASHLPADRFMQVHRSYVVALAKIEFIEHNRIVINKKYIPISKTYHKSFWERIKSN